MDDVNIDNNEEELHNEAAEQEQEWTASTAAVAAS